MQFEIENIKESAAFKSVSIEGTNEQDCEKPNNGQEITYKINKLDTDDTNDNNDDSKDTE